MQSGAMVADCDNYHPLLKPLQTDNLLDYMYIGDEKGSTAVNLLPSVSTSVIPSCYIDGCYEYTSGRVTTTYAIPTVTCSCKYNNYCGKVLLQA